MTQPDDASSPDEGIQPDRRRAILLGLGSSVAAVAALFLSPVLGNFATLWLIIPLVALAAASYQRRGTGFGVGVAWGCGVMLVIGGGACIALLVSYR